MVVQVFSSWRQVTVKRSITRSVVKVAVNRLRNQAMAAAFITWKGWAQQHANHKVILQTAIQRLLHRTSMSTFQSWREAVQQGLLLKHRLQVYCVVTGDLLPDFLCQSAESIHPSS